MLDGDAKEDGKCFCCGKTAPWIILVAGEDEKPHEEWACEEHARGHWRWALVTPVTTEVELSEYDYGDTRFAW